MQKAVISTSWDSQKKERMIICICPGSGVPGTYNPGQEKRQPALFGLFLFGDKALTRCVTQ